MTEDNERTCSGPVSSASYMSPRHPRLCSHRVSSWRCSGASGSDLLQSTNPSVAILRQQILLSSHFCGPMQQFHLLPAMYTLFAVAGCGSSCPRHGNTRDFGGISRPILLSQDRDSKPIILCYLNFLQKGSWLSI